MQAQNCLVICWLGFSVLRTLQSVLHVTLCTFHSLQQLQRLPTSCRPSPAFIVPGCLNGKHSDWWVMIPWCKIQSLLLNLYPCGSSFLGDFIAFNYFNWRLITVQYCGRFWPYIHMNQPWVSFVCCASHIHPSRKHVMTSCPSVSSGILFW